MRMLSLSRNPAFAFAMAAAMVVLALPMTSGCTQGPGTSPDPDASSWDGAPPDGAPPDGAQPDGAPPQDARTDAAPPDAGPTPDSGPDASWVDATPNPHVILLPPTGETYMGGMNNGGLIITYSDTRGPPENKQDVFYYDILSGQEVNITDRPGEQLGPYTDGASIIYEEGIFYDAANEYYRVDLQEYDIASGVETKLTESPSRKTYPVFNDDYILFKSTEGCGSNSHMNLSLMSRHTGEITVISECGLSPETHSISQHYAAWSARLQPGGWPKVVHVRDLYAGVTFRPSQSLAEQQFFSHADESHVIWQDHRDGRREIYKYSFSTGLEEPLTPDPWEQAWPHLRDGIATWCDYRHSQQFGEYAPCDIYVYEMATGVSRRVTSESKTWMPRYVDSGWIFYVLWITGHQFKLYAHDLVSDGILTPDGHVIP